MSWFSKTYRVHYIFGNWEGDETLGILAVLQDRA